MHLINPDKFINYLSDLQHFKLLDVFHVIPGVGISENKNIGFNLGWISKFQNNKYRYIFSLEVKKFEGNFHDLYLLNYSFQW